MTRRIKIKFPQAPGQYWYLYFIGPINYSKRKRVSFYFVNKNKLDDLLRDFNLDYTHKVSASVSYLFDLEIGSIYNIESQRFVSYSIPISRSRIIQISNGLNFTKNPYPLLRNPYFPKIDDNVLSDLKYLKCYYKKGEKRSGYAFVKPYELAKNLLFSTPKVINKILSGDIFDGIRVEWEALKINSETNETQIEIHFDQSKLKNCEAIAIAPLLVMKNDFGIKMIESIYSNLSLMFQNCRKKGKRPKGFLNMYFPFKNYSLHLTGKQFKSDLTDGVNEHFLPYRLNKIEFSGSLFKTDKVLLIPYNSRTPTKDRINHEQIEVVRPLQISTEAISLQLNQDGAVRDSSTPEILEGYSNPFNLDVEIVDRTIQDNSWKVIPFAQDYEGLVRNLENAINDINNLETDLIKEYTYLEGVDNYRYFTNLIRVLKNEHNLSILTDPLGIGENYPKSYSLADERSFYLVDIKGISNGKKTIYLLEFGRGYIGVFSTINWTPASSESLATTLRLFIDDVQNLPERKSLWTYIYENRANEKYRRLNILIQEGIEHRREGIEDEMYIKTAKRIYNHRLVKATL